ncbi:M-phase phosphoprotein 9 isoform X3 [Entelurus aequoreus]|uniref:M-phase phosphoprotein 9 isoform X3 n=1 Tax=Entelurus aequoreus TaxID=161455 RepID=UPI002B1E732D|nr:M-phase phosphoprotein 9 isoform X3 [Entelurus aequoreus]
MSKPNEETGKPPVRPPPARGPLSMSTDDSVSEDVSSSGPLSHCRASADGDGGKESEASPLSSEATTASGLAVSEDRVSASQTTGGTVASRPVKLTPACDKIRGLCLGTDGTFPPGRNLPFINPSSLETLRALVEEIRSSGEMDPKIWKDCEVRWLHLFQLVEKQYQEQILAQQDQYQCQIQLIQDEIKALVQLQNRQASLQQHADFPQTPTVKTGDGTKDFILPFIPADCAFPRRVASDGDSPAAPALSPFSSPSPPPQRSETANPGEERTATVLSSGYGTLSTWETGPEAEPRCSAGVQEDGEESHEPSVHQQKTCGQVLTSWAMRQKVRSKKNKAVPSQIPEYEELPRSNAESARPPPESTDSQEQEQEQLRHPAASSSGFFPLRRSDSFLSETSGLTYWRLNECDLYHPLPDGFESGAYFLQEVSTAQAAEPRISLRELYQHKQRTDVKRSDWERSETASPLQAEAATARQSDRSSAFTSPSRFALLRPGPPMTPDSMAECSLGTDNVSEVSQEVPPTSQVKTCPAAAREEKSGHTRSSTLKPGSPSGTSLDPPRSPRTSSLGDPVVLSLLRQNLREKHSRHVADLKAYYESEIQVLRDKLDPRHLPGDLERGNRVLAERCERLEKALAEATKRIQQLEATNASLEKKLAEWPDRYAVAGAAVKSLRQRLEDGKRSAREKDATAARLRACAKQQEAAALKARQEADESEAKMEREGKMMKELLAQYERVEKDKEGLKDNLLAKENKLARANDEILELKRNVSKLEGQVRQLEHENQARVCHTLHGVPQSSVAGLYHHPDLLRSPSRGNTQPDITRKRSPCPEPDPPFRIIPPASVETLSTGRHLRCASPQGVEAVSPQSARRQEESSGQRETTPSLLTPIMRAIMEMEETRATESRAPWLASPRPTLGVVELRHKSPLQERHTAGREALGGGSPCAAQRSPLGPQRSLSPDGLRSSSLPPPGLRSIGPTTPTKRETLLAPLSAKSSPKRCPTENYSTAFAHMMPREEHLHQSFDADQRRHSLHSGSTPRKRLHFSSGDAHLGCEEDTPPPHVGQVQSLAEAERLFDELTQEKLQIEAALSRMPASGARVSMQTRLDQVALEERLERLNGDLGSIRMTLKRFHVLRSSANT